MPTTTSFCVSPILTGRVRRFPCTETMSIRTDQDAIEYIASLEAQADRVETTHANGGMVWHAWGEPNERPDLVFLHGGSGSWTHWIRNIPHFMADYRVVAGDLPGLGDSPSPDEPYSAESLSEIISGGLDEVVPNGRAFELVGFSFGGIVGGHIASLQAPRMKGLTVVGSPPFGLGPTGRANEVVPVARSLDFEAARAIHRHNLELFMIEDAAKVDALALRVHHDNLRRFRLRSRKIARSDTLARAMRRAPCPVRGVWGSEDVTAHPSVEAIRELFLEFQPETPFTVLPGVGHWAAYEDHERFNRLLAQFLAG